MMFGRKETACRLLGAEMAVQALWLMMMMMMIMIIIIIKVQNISYVK